MTTVPLYVSFFLHANLQYAELPASAAPVVVEQSYRPVCELFMRRPWAKAVFEFSGYTLELLAEGYPDVIDRLRELVRRGQVELCASTYANPILPLIPLDHARRQVAMFRVIYDGLFGDLGIAPAGFFPQEFALDPSLAPLLGEYGYRWVPVMLNHYLESLVERLNIIPDLPLRASVPRGEVAADLMHPFQILGAGGARLDGLINNPAMIDLLFELANGVIDVDAALAAIVALHQRHSGTGPAFLFAGPSDMEFVGLELRAFVPDWRWPAPIRPEHLEALLDRLRQLPFVRFATAREYLDEFPPPGPPLYLKCGSDHPLLTPWTLDPDNERLNLLCAEAAGRIQLAEGLAAIAGPSASAPALLEQAWRALLLAENSDGRGWLPIPERRLFCYDQALRALDLADRALNTLCVSPS
jgi:glycosyl hydrolase family 57